MGTEAAPSYRGFRFPPEVISHCVWLYHRFNLSLRDVEELMLERGVVVSCETVHQWTRRFGPAYAAALLRRRPKAGDKWHLDEVFRGATTRLTRSSSASAGPAAGRRRTATSRQRVRTKTLWSRCAPTAPLPGPGDRGALGSLHADCGRQRRSARRGMRAERGPAAVARLRTDPGTLTDRAKPRTPHPSRARRRHLRRRSAPADPHRLGAGLRNVGDSDGERVAAAGLWQAGARDTAGVRRTPGWNRARPGSSRVRDVVVAERLSSRRAS